MTNEFSNDQMLIKSDLEGQSGVAQTVYITLIMFQLITLLAILGLTACGREVVRVEVQTPALASQQTPLHISDGTYSDFGLQFCAGGSCSFNAAPPSCAGIVTFHDFTIYDRETATFFTSVSERVTIDEVTRTITLTTAQTGHSGYSFSYEYIGAADQWEITYGPNCGRRYVKL